MRKNGSTTSLPNCHWKCTTTDLDIIRNKVTYSKRLLLFIPNPENSANFCVRCGLIHFNVFFQAFRDMLDFSDCFLPNMTF